MTLKVSAAVDQFDDDNNVITSATLHSDRHTHAMADPEYQHRYILQSHRIAAIDRIMNILDEAQDSGHLESRACPCD